MAFILRQKSTGPLKQAGGGGQRAGGQVTLDFGQPVEKYMIGLNAFNLAFPKSGGDHWIQDVYLRLDFPDPPQSGTVDKVTVDVSADMHDASGNHLSPEESWGTVACLAWSPDAGGPPPVMGNWLDIKHNRPFTLGIQSPGKRQFGVLSGFHIGDKTDHQIQKLTINAPEPDGQQSTVQMHAEHRGGRMYYDSPATLDVGAAAIDLPAETLRDQTDQARTKNLRWHVGTGRWGKFDLGLPVFVPVNQVVTMISGINIGFWEPRNVLAINAFAGNGKPDPETPPPVQWPGPQPPTAWYSRANVFQEPEAFLHPLFDSSGKSQFVTGEARMHYWVFATIDRRIQ